MDHMNFKPKGLTNELKTCAGLKWIDFLIMFGQTILKTFIIHTNVVLYGLVIFLIRKFSAIHLRLYDMLVALK